MNRQKFVQILKDQNDIHQDDLKSIEGLEKNYPYSQVLHILSAIGSYKIKSKNAKQKLSIAAVYSMDRSVLKDSMIAVDSPVMEKASAGNTAESQKSERPVRMDSKSATPSHSEAVKEEKKPVEKHIVDKPSGRPGNLTSDEAEALRQEVMKNLEDLMLIKSNFMNDQKGSPPKQKVKKKPKKIREPKTKKEIPDKKKQEGISVDKDRKDPNNDKASKVHIKEQSKIIDRFIKEEPVIKKVKKKGKQKDQKENKNQNDLSEESVEFGENLVSENLAKIMVKQGKNRKAIDIYKKLIWKYPQKKAYFASQIESIKQK